MTEEQIKQNAEEWVKSLISEEDGGYNENDVSLFLIKNAFIAGAHSRDEEIKELKEEIESLQEQYNTCFDGFTKRGTKMGELMKENVKLRNPWISVEKHPDDVTKDYLLEYEDGSHIVAIWDSGMWMSKNLHPLKEPIRWMFIPQTEKGEKN